MCKQLLRKILPFLFIASLAACGGGGDEDGGGEPSPVEPSAGTFTTVSAGADHACGILDTGAVACWGLDDEGQSTPPAGTFTMVSAGADHACGILDTGAVECWGLDDEGQSTPPAGTFTMVSAGADHACGILDTGAVACWGLDDEGQSTPSAGTFTMVSAGTEHTCGILDTGAVECWGLNDEGQSTPPAGTFTMVSAGAEHTCGILDTGAVACWGLDDEGQSTPPAGTFTMVSAGTEHTCGILDTGIVACWRLDDQGQSIPPGGTFTAVSAGGNHTCGILNTGTVECWGLDDQGQAASPDPAAKMDLVIHSPRVSDNSPSTEASFTLSVTVRNNGVEASTPTMLRYYSSTDTTITTSDTLVMTDAVLGLASSTSTSKSVQLTAPSTAGIYYYGACVDAVPGESDTANNCSVSVRVTVSGTQQPVQGQPDLVVGTPTVGDASVETGGSFTLSATVSNQGDGGSPATTLRYYWSTDQMVTTTHTEVGTDDVGALAATGTSEESISLTARNSMGRYWYGACVDVVADESNTTNNCSAPVAVRVEAPQQPEGVPSVGLSRVSISVTEGMPARYTVTATPPPTADLVVNVQYIEFATVGAKPSTTTGRQRNRRSRSPGVLRRRH